MGNDINLKQQGAFPFPKDDIAPAKKENKPFGLDIAKAIWGYASTFSTNLFYNDRDNYKVYRDYALGRQSEDKYRPLLNEEFSEKKQEWLKAISFKIKNYATKRINITVAKMYAKDYDVTVSMVDPMAKSIMANVRASMEVKMKFKKELDSISALTKTNAFGDIPESKEELEMVMETDFKMIEAIHLENAIPYHLERNQYEEIRPLVDFDLATLGVAGINVGMDENLRPMLERVNPADIIAPYNEHPNLDTLPYIARIKWVTASEFTKMARGYMSDKRIEEIIEEFSTKQYDQTYGDTDIRRFDDVAKIPLLHYNYKSTDTMVDLEKDDEFGNKKLFRKSIDYYARPKEMDKFKEKYGDSRQIHRTTINAVYEGYWVIGSEDVFRHGRRSFSLDGFGAFNTTGMGFKVFAPNSWDGKVTSMTAQMIPVLDELQRYNLKIQQLVARAIPKGIGIDLYALRKANLSWGGKSLSDQEKIEMFMKSGIFAFSSKDRYAAGSNYKPFYEVENGLANDIDKYLNLIQASLMELDEIIGINKVVAASNVREDAGKAVTELQVGASEVALDYLYKADNKIYRQVVREIGRLHVQSYVYSKKNQVIYDAMFGATGFAQNAVRFDLFDYGFDIEARPTPAEWQDVYVGAENAYKNGLLTYSDTLMLREFKSIKQARAWLMMRERKALDAQNQAKQKDIEANAAVQQQSIITKGQIDEIGRADQFEKDSQIELMKRDTITHQNQAELNKEEKLLALQAESDRRENAQEGKIKDRHIDAEGDIDITLKEMDISARPAPSTEKKQK